MGKRKKGSHSGAVGQSSRLIEEDAKPTARYDEDETFADSQDEFFAGKDQIMLEESPSRKRRNRNKEEDQYLEPSDEEVLGYDEDEDIGDRDGDSADGDQSEDDAEDRIQDWGISKADYYNADVIQTEVDAQEEETEARRLQQKQLQNMTEADFGFDETQWTQALEEQDENRNTVVEKLPELTVTESTPVAERLKILKSRYPELQPLANDYVELRTVYEELKISGNAELSSNKQLSKKRKAGQDEPIFPLSITALKWRALSIYVGSIAMYFALLTAPSRGKPGAAAPTPPAELRQHPVMQSLLRSRKAWDLVKDLETPVPEDFSEGLNVASEDKKERPEQVGLAVDAVEPAVGFLSSEKKSKKPEKQKEHLVLSSKQNKSAQKKAGGVLSELDNLIASVQNSSTARTPGLSASDNDSDFGDEDGLTAQEAAEKAQRKKGLRFYTSQLAQKANKRGAASRDAGGDADLPYKERLKDRQARLMREAEKRGGEQAQLEHRLDYEDEDEDEEETSRVAKEIRGDANDSDDYYQTISSNSKAKKAEKAARATAYTKAAKIGGQVYIEDTVGEDGKRGITYEISKNKGLMPRRKKEVRNPRVKKRMKYDEKLKKLGSMRQVYKGGEGKGGYGGELSGIKTNVVRSVKL